LQGSLPIRDGGLCVRRVALFPAPLKLRPYGAIQICLLLLLLTLPAFLAAASGTVSLQDATLAGYACPNDLVLESYWQTWSSTFGLPSLMDAVIHKQSAWNKSGVCDLASAESSLVTSGQKASFLAAASPRSGDWLYALPITSWGLRLDAESVRVAVRL